MTNMEAKARELHARLKRTTGPKMPICLEFLTEAHREGQRNPDIDTRADLLKEGANNYAQALQEGVLISVRANGHREGMEEAAKVMCWRCREGTKHDKTWCMAAAIREKIKRR